MGFQENRGLAIAEDKIELRVELAQYPAESAEYRPNFTAFTMDGPMSIEGRLGMTGAEAKETSHQ